MSLPHPACGGWKGTSSQYVRFGDPGIRDRAAAHGRRPVINAQVVGSAMERMIGI
jgi:hypothetical protein